jgi:hypothetical protein
MTTRKRKPGRKALPVSEKRGCKVTVYLTRSELAALRAEGQPGTVLRETWVDVHTANHEAWARTVQRIFR